MFRTADTQPRRKARGNVCKGCFQGYHTHCTGLRVVPHWGKMPCECQVCLKRAEIKLGERQENAEC